MPFKRTQAHFRQNNDPPADIARECSEVDESGAARTLIQLTNRGFFYLMEHYPPVMKVADLDGFPSKLPKGEEIGFSPVFDPNLIDQCCIRGIFPLALAIGQNMFIFAPKLHQERSICALVDTPEQMRAIKHFPASDDLKGAFQQSKLHISHKLLRAPNATTRQASLDVYVNRKEDWVDALKLLRAQHGENWLCEALRKCFYWLLLNPEKSRTKVFLTVLRRHRYGGECVSTGEDQISEGDLVAAELGYIVGDVYSSATGAYCLDGAGTLQLAVTGEVVKRLGCKVWDLGMKMDYKSSILSCVEVRRKKWQTMMSDHRSLAVMDSSAARELLQRLTDGCPVADFINENPKKGAPPATNSSANPESKSQRKRQAKLELRQQRKLRNAKRCE